MSDFTNNFYFQLIIIIGLIGYALFCLYKSIKAYLNHLKLKKEYQEKFSGKYEYQQDFYVWAIVYGLVSTLAFIMGIINLGGEDKTLTAGFFFMGVFCICFVLDVVTKRQSFFDETGFFFENKHYKYRSVIRLQPRKSLISSYDLILTGQTIRISRKMGDVLEIKLKEYKKRKKNK